jgi:hypothetical protein
MKHRKRTYMYVLIIDLTLDRDVNAPKVSLVFRYNTSHGCKVGTDTK